MSEASPKAAPQMAGRPPFRADHVGSLLRPAELKRARLAHEAGTLADDALRTIEDRLIATAIRGQEEAGLLAATDGEFRRAHWAFDFLAGFDGVRLFRPEKGIQFKGAVVPVSPAVTGRITWRAPTFQEDFRYVAGQVQTAMPKQTIPAPSMLHYRAGPDGIDRSIYPDMEQFFADLGQAYHGAVSAFAAHGCRYLQLDEVILTYLCDPEQLALIRGRGEDPQKLLQIYAGMSNAAIAGRPADMIVSMHLCRGNFRSSWFASGGYEPVAEVMFNDINVDAYFMEYDSERAGGFEPLRFLPKGHKRVVLGLVTTKQGVLETKDELKRRIDQAAKFVPLEQLAISPQCGFASTEEGNVLTEAEQWAKLRLCVAVAQEVWGSL